MELSCEALQLWRDSFVHGCSSNSQWCFRAWGKQKPLFLDIHLHLWARLDIRETSLYKLTAKRRLALEVVVSRPLLGGFMSY